MLEIQCSAVQVTCCWLGSAPSWPEKKLAAVEEIIKKGGAFNRRNKKKWRGWGGLCVLCVGLVVKAC